MNFSRLLLSICLAMLFEADALKRFHRDVDDKDTEIDELSEDIRIHHLSHALIFGILGPQNHITKRRITGFSTKTHKAGRSRCISKRCFTPSGPNSWWPEYGWMDGCGYPFKGSNNKHGFGIWNQPFFQCKCGKWCSEYNSKQLWPRRTRQTDKFTFK